MRALAVILLLAAAVPADVLRLADGREVRGPVLKESEESLFVDLGFTVLVVPKKAVLAREVEGSGEEETAPAKAVASEDLYSTVDRLEASVRDNVARTEGAVVMVQTPSGLGSGFILTPDGYLITNDHVIQGETRIAVVIFGKDERGVLKKTKVEDVKIVATNPHVDLALLKMEGVKDLPIAYLGDSDGLTPGQTVYAIGNPHGLDRTVSEGIVSTLNRVMDGQTHIQTTTPINPGNSGGPLFNLKGEVIGVVDLGGVMTEGLNFAIPVSRVKRFLKEREAFAYDKDNANSGYRYLEPPPKTRKPTPAPGKAD